MKFKAVVALLFLAACLLSSCVVKKFNYHDVLADINASGNLTVAVAVLDQREYVLSKDKAPDFVGLNRTALGSVWNVYTDSGNPLAQDMTDSISKSLARKGFKIVAVNVSHTENRNSVLEKLKATKGERLLLLTLNDWRNHIYNYVSLTFDVKLEVLDAGGNVRAIKTLKGTEDVGGRGGGIPTTLSKEVVPKAYKEKMEQMLNDPDIAKSLK